MVIILEGLVEEEGEPHNNHVGGGGGGGYNGGAPGANYHGAWSGRRWKFILFVTPY